jgi:hypothetical protein
LISSSLTHLGVSGSNWRTLWLKPSADYPGSILFNRSIRHCLTEIVVYRYRPRGTLRTNFPLFDVFDSHKIEKTHHKWQQAISESIKLIQCLSRPGETVCDLCVGSGTVLAAVAQVGGRKFVGSDIEQKLVNAALGSATG